VEFAGALQHRLLLLPLRAEPLTQIRGKWKNISGQEVITHEAQAFLKFAARK
jgi:hypothetical protein